MVTKTIPSKPKPEAKEADFSNEDATLSPEQEKAAREKAKSLSSVNFFLDNLIYFKKETYVIDHQDLHYNHPCLDIASLIFDARRSYSTKLEEKVIKDYARKSGQSLGALRDDIHRVSLARNLRILGNWVKLYQAGKTHYLKKFRKYNVVNW